MAISAPGIGSGLDIKGIVTQLLALEKKPLAQLQTTASSYQAKLSAFGQLKSQIANLQDQVAKLADPKNWGGMSFSSSNTASVSGSATALAQATQFSVQVTQLAQAQATASAVFAGNPATVGAGTLTIDIGGWDGNTFTAGEAAAVAVDIADTDNLSDIASKINAANAGVTATVLRDASGERLLMRSTDTGVDTGFRVQASGDAALDALTYNPPATGGMARTQEALNTQATVNGVAVTSTNNKLEDAVPGVSLNFLQVTSGPVEVNVTADKAGARTNLNNLVESYNALSKALTLMTRFEPGTKTAGTLQGDSTAVGLQNTLRRILGGTGPEGTSFKWLSDTGLEFQEDGTLKINNTKLDSALNNMGDVKAFFTASGSGNQNNGLAVRLEDFTKGLLASNGTLTSKNKNLEDAIARNTREQTRLNEKIERTEARLLAQYSRLDGNLASLNALSSYVAQQVTTWNNQKTNY